ncbi:MAG TPA: ROK family transcriptional regulator [Bryobacteraceae bacterium]|nr:ROK family transcriptional regulator [Bryobacteraceae bacterium]
MILNVIRQNPSVSRADIVRITGLSPSSVTFIVKRLKREKIVWEERLPNLSQIGRHPTALRLRGEARIAIGVEITPSGARIAVSDLNDKDLDRKTVPWSPNADVFFEKVRAALHTLLQPLSPGQILGVAVGLPGTIDRSVGKIVAAENFGWFDVDAGERLRRNLKVPFYFENAAKLSALAEMWSSNRGASPLRNFVSVIARGGVGTGVVVNGQLLHGATSAAAEFGHISLYPDGRKCPCGNIGCWEQYASDLALVRTYAEETEEKSASEETVEGIINKAREGEPAARRALQTTARYVGMGFVNLVLALNPQAIIVGDYLAQAWDLIEEDVWAVLRRRTPSYFLAALRIFPSLHGADSTLRGAVALALNRFFNTFGDGHPTKPSSAVTMQEFA